MFTIQRIILLVAAMAVTCLSANASATFLSRTLPDNALQNTRLPVLPRDLTPNPSQSRPLAFCGEQCGFNRPPPDFLPPTECALHSLCDSVPITYPAAERPISVNEPGIFFLLISSLLLSFTAIFRNKKLDR